MPENLDNSPATKAQVEAYKADPLSPTGKPYSSKQKESNEKARGRNFMYHKDKGSRIFEAGEEAPEGWKDTPFTNHNDDNVPISTEPEEPPTPIDVNILRDECEKRNIEYDKRWGKQKLMEALENADS